MTNNEYDEIFAKLMACVHSVKGLFSSLRAGERSTIGFEFARALLIRLSASLEVSGSMIRQGYAVELIVLARFVHEQLAYAYSLRLEDDLDRVERLKVTKCIAKYKERIDYIGNLYGMTTEFAHLDARLNNFYLKGFNPEKGKGTILSKYSDKEIGYTMLLTLTMAVELYLDMVFVFLDVDDLRRSNPQTAKQSDEVKIELDNLIECIKRSV